MQSDQEEEGQSRTPLEDVLLRRQQKQLEVINTVYRFRKASSMAENASFDLFMQMDTHCNYRVNCIKGQMKHGKYS